MNTDSSSRYIKLTKDILLNDKHFNDIAIYLLSNAKHKLGRFISISTMPQFIDLLTKSCLEEVKYLPKSNLYMYRTYDLGMSYVSEISPIRLNELISFGKVKKDIPVTLEYKFGNIFSYIKSEDIDDKLLLADDVYFLIRRNGADIKVYNIFLGKPTNPNYLYYKTNLNNVTTTLYKAMTLRYLNRIHIREKIKVDFI